MVRSERLGYESPRWNPGLGFTFFLIRNTQNQVKNFPSVLEMAATFYERDNCGSVYLSGLYKGVSPPPGSKWSLQDLFANVSCGVFKL